MTRLTCSPARAGSHASSASLLLAAFLVACAAARPESQDRSPGVAAPDAAWHTLAQALVPNAGQWPEHVCFATTSRQPLWIERDAIVLAAPTPAGGRQVVRLRLLDADPRSAPRGEHALPGNHSFFLGADRAAWRGGLVAHDRVRWAGVRPGVDVVIDTAGAAPEYQLELAAGADLADVRLRCEGAERIEVQPDGSLRLAGAAATLVQSAPLAWRIAGDGRRTPVHMQFRVFDATTFGFTSPDLVPGEGLLVDPMLQWGTFVGGSAYEWGYDVCRENDGTVLVVGETTSSNFPTSAGAFDPSYNGFGPPTSDVFVARIQSNGTGIVYATYLGGSGADKALGVQGNGNGVATVVGSAGSTNFPTTAGAYDTTLGGSSDAFVTRLTADGTALVFSTLLGGSGDDMAEDLAVTTNGETWLTGVTSSPSFPTTAGAFSATRAGTSDVFVARISATGAQLLAGSLIGGSDGEVGKGVAVGPGGSAVVGGVTSSANFPTTPGAFQSTLLGSSDAFVARFSSTCQLLGSTLVGGSGGDVGEAAAATTGGLLLVAGVTSSGNFPVTPGAFQTTTSGSSDAFVAAFDLSMQRRWATLVGGNGGDVGKSLSVTARDTIVLGGQCSSSVFPTSPGAVLAAGSGSADAFVVHLAVDGSGMLAGTLFGGSGSDGGEAIDGREPAAVAATGVCNSGNLPVSPGAWSPSQLGTNDAFAAVLDLRAAGIVNYGSSTPSCLGVVEASATRWPGANASDFAIACLQAPPFTVGVLAIGFQPWPGVPVLGVAAFVDLSLPTLLYTALSDDRGGARVPLSLAGVPASAHFYAQFAWFNPPGCGAPGGMCASDALDIVVQ